MSVTHNGGMIADLSSSYAFAQNSGGVTMMAWITPRTNGSNPVESNLIFFTTGTSSTNIRCCLTLRYQALLYRLSARRLDADAVITLDSATSAAVDTRVHLCGVFNFSGTSLVMYINGVSDASSSPAGWTGNSSNTASQNARIGLLAISGRTYATYEDARLYQRVLTAQEIGNIYNARGSDGVVNGLYERWKLMDGYTGETWVATTTTVQSIGSKQGVGVATSASGTASTFEESFLTTRRRRM